ncbi:hypothetical protein M3Y98_00564200 [Aphelenchoides besseyi]|nr:hypothetical protein M3Y98_00564200 [Aphelenchoides besseyi]
MSVILPIIENIRREKRFSGAFAEKLSILHNQKCDLDDGERVIYNSAEVHPDCLDRGSDITHYTACRLVREGAPGDRALQLINKRLGGPGHHFNFFPVNKKIDMTEWKENETKIYEHVKKGGNRHAFMAFAAEYDDENEFEICRPIKIYYHFALYENNERVGDFMEGVIDNPSPRGYKKII